MQSFFHDLSFTGGVTTIFNSNYLGVKIRDQEEFWMVTFYASSNNQRDSLPMFYLRDPLLSSYSEAPVFPSNMMMYMNYPSSLVSKQQNNFMEIPMVAASESAPEQQEVLPEVGDFNGWKRNEMLVMQQSSGSGPSNILNNGQNFQSQGLSLTLSTQIPSAIQISSMPHCHLNDSLLSLNLFDLGDGGCRDGSSKEEHYRSGEYHLAGYQESIKGDLLQYSMPSVARIIPNSKYLKAAQQLLDEVVNVKKALNLSHNERNRSLNEDGTKTSNNKAVLHENGASSSIQESESSSPSELSHAERQDLQNKLTKLLSMLDEVDRRYKQYYHQMQIVVSSFDAIAGCGAAKPYTALALQTISRHFRCLRDTISGQIRVTRKSLGKKDFSGSGKEVGIPRLRYVDQQLRQQKALQQLGMVQQHAWRPQRGLPETSVSILRAWLFEHFLHPYPKDSDKIMLARQTGLTRNQVSNWFINARVRLWKPMVEEMHKEEIGDVEIDSNSSSEETAKAAKGDKRAAEDTGEDLQQSASSTANQLLDSMADQVTNAKMAGPTRLHGREARNEYGWVKRRIEPRPNVDDSNVFPATNMAGSVSYNVAELGTFGQGNGVSLTLGLQHCENRNVLMGLRGGGIYNGSAASLGGTVDFECMNSGNPHQRFGSSHLYHDFVV